MFRCFLLSSQNGKLVLQKKHPVILSGSCSSEVCWVHGFVEKMLRKIPKAQVPFNTVSSQINLVVFQKKGVEVQHPSKFNSLKSNHNFQKAKKSKVEWVSKGIGWLGLAIEKKHNTGAAMKRYEMQDM